MMILEAILSWAVTLEFWKVFEDLKDIDHYLNKLGSNVSVLNPNPTKASTYCFCPVWFTMTKFESISFYSPCCRL